MSVRIVSPQETIRAAAQNPQWSQGIALLQQHWARSFETRGADQSALAGMLAGVVAVASADPMVSDLNVSLPLALSDSQVETLAKVANLYVDGFQTSAPTTSRLNGGRSALRTVLAEVLDRQPRILEPAAQAGR